MNKYAKGALLGLAVGDALGTTLEFSRPQAARDVVFPNQLKGPHTEVTGGGPFRVDVGQVTDDTQMAVALATSIQAENKFDADKVASAYAAWRGHAFDIGGQTSGALSHVGRVPAGLKYTAGFESWRVGRQAAGNGSLMRTAPIGAIFADDLKEVVRVSVLDSAITHADPRCLLACAAYNCAIATAVNTEGAAPVFHLFWAAEEGLEAAVKFINKHPVLSTWFTPEELDRAVRDLCDDLDLADSQDPKLVPLVHDSAGFVRTAFRYAFWALRHSTNYRDALIGVVNMGGDADTNGAIVGGLLGAYYGVDGIPQAWRNAVATGVSKQPTSVWWTTYHPRFFFEEGELVVTEPLIAERYTLREGTIGGVLEGTQSENNSDVPDLSSETV